MNEKDCEVCKKMIKAKYKHYRTWQVLAIVFICVAVLFAILYFASGKMFVEETIENNITIENADGGNENNVITGENSTISGTIENADGGNENNVITGENSTISGTIKTESNIGVVIFVCVFVSVAGLSGGFICGCYIVSQKKSDK